MDNNTQSENNKRIAKNTLLLYFRMILTMLVSLYTSRVVLNTLGVTDYGINNVVGGIVTMLGFLTGAMGTTTQRYITFALGKGDTDNLRIVFNSCQLIYAIISLIVVVVAETAGLWFLNTKMQIPIDRMDAAYWVFQCSILSAVVGIISVPYNAIIVAHEKMSAFAYISILEVVLKLLIVYLLVIFSLDKLKLYAVLLLLVQISIRLIYSSYCYRHFPESRFKWVANKSLLKEMTSFTGWNMFGNLAAVAFTQGLNMLLNMFFGPAVNAARGVAVQVQSAIAQFSTNFQMALNPQITKSYASEHYADMHKLIIRSSKFTFFLLLFLSLPVLIETQTILTVWLKIVPDYTVAFLRIMICTTIIDAVANPLMVAAASTGKVKLYQSVVGGILLAILPISYVVLKLGGNPESVFLVHLSMCLLAFATRLYIIRPMIKISLTHYFREAIFKCLLVACVAVPLPVALYYYSATGWTTFFSVCLLCVFTVSVSAYYIGFDISERNFFKNKVLVFAQKIRR